MLRFKMMPVSKEFVYNGYIKLLKFCFLIQLIIVSLTADVYGVLCYECSYDPESRLPIDKEPNCQDPFNATGIETYDCYGKDFCLKVKMQTSGPDAFYRTCVMQCATGEQAWVGAHEVLCCQDDLCNSAKRSTQCHASYFHQICTVLTAGCVSAILLLWKG